MKLLLGAILTLLTGVPAFSQTFSIITKDGRTKSTLEKQLEYDGYKVVDSSTAHDYDIEFRVNGNYKAISLKRTHEGYAILKDAKTGAELYRTKEYKSSPEPVNGYNASYAIIQKTIKKEYDAMIGVVKTNSTKNK